MFLNEDTVTNKYDLELSTRWQIFFENATSY